MHAWLHEHHAVVEMLLGLACGLAVAAAILVDLRRRDRRD